MVAYGWTLEETMALTFPQVRRFSEAIAKWPPVNIVIPAIINAMREKGEDVQDIAAKAGTVAEKVMGGAFLHTIGVEGA